MCGILAFSGKNTAQNRELIVALMLQLSLRGTHATGIATVVNNQLRVVRMPVDAKTFFERVTLDSPSNSNPDLKLIGHTRYSTSDLQWNQPVDNGYTALVMNGVISQEPPEKWPEAYRPYSTRNDAEIALNASMKGHYGCYNGSFAIAELQINGSLLVYRNAYRPMWAACGPDQSWCVVSSTADSLLRCGLKPFRMAPGEVIDIGNVPMVVIEKFITTPDQQPSVISQFPNLQCNI